MSIYSDPPPLRSFTDDKPTLLVCWWTTIFSAAIIVLRVSGRFVRTERLFREDKTAALALIPLFLRMGCVHYILVHGTNNANFDGVVMSAEELRGREIASGLVLASRVLYAATLWIFKITIVEFFKRLTDLTWERKRRKYLNFIYLILGFTFVAVIVSDLVECRPFPHYWQVLPDPGPQCRQGYVQLLTLATSNVLTDLLLVLFPVPIILHSAMSVKRKFQLVLLFSLGLAVVAITLYRVPHTIRKNGSQQYRSLMASIEILFAAAAANTLVLGSFVRDRGVKKQKFRHGSDDLGSGLSRDEESIIRYRSRSQPRPVAPVLHRHWGSDEDLVRGLGIALKPELRAPEYGADTDLGPGRGKDPAAPSPTAVDMHGWEFPRGDRESSERRAGCDTRSEEALLTDRRRGSSATGHINRPLSFFDVGDLLGEGGAARKGSAASDAHQRLDAMPPSRPGPPRRGSAALLQDLGGFLSSSARPKGRALSVPTSAAGPSSPAQARAPRMSEMQDVGGLAS